MARGHWQESAWGDVIADCPARLLAEQAEAAAPFAAEERGAFSGLVHQCTQHGSDMVLQPKSAAVYGGQPQRLRAERELPVSPAVQKTAVLQRAGKAQELSLIPI